MDPTRKTLARVRHFLASEGMALPGERILVGVSGGPDSMALLDMLVRLREDVGVDIVAAHFDHGLRPGEDQAETALVEAFAKTSGIAFVAGKAPQGPPPKGSLEAWAREVRYAFLNRARKESRAQRIAVGHTLDDQAETLLLNLLRGSGPKGLSAMAPTREGLLVRPLLTTQRREILAYLAARKIPSLLDSSNFTQDFLRNRIRAELLPLLAAYQPRIVPRLARTADLLRRDDRYLDARAGEWLTRHGTREGAKGIRLEAALLLDLPEALGLRVVRRALEACRGDLQRIGLVHVEAILGIARGPRPQASLDLPGGTRVRRCYGDLLFDGPLEEAPPFLPLVLPGPGTYALGALAGSVTLEAWEGVPPPLPRDTWEILLDRDRLDYPLVLRGVRPGDRLVPLGMTGHKKVKEILQERRIPRDLRPRIPLLFWGDTLLWVCGLKRDARCVVGPDTRRTLRVRLECEELRDRLPVGRG